MSPRASKASGAWQMTPARAESVKRMQAGNKLKRARTAAQRVGVDTTGEAPAPPADGRVSDRAGAPTVSVTPYKPAQAPRAADAEPRSASDSERDSSERADRPVSDASVDRSSKTERRSLTEILRLTVGLD